MGHPCPVTAGAGPPRSLRAWWRKVGLTPRRCMLGFPHPSGRAATGRKHSGGPLRLAVHVRAWFRRGRPGDASSDRLAP